MQFGNTKEIEKRQKRGVVIQSVLKLWMAVRQ